MTNDIIHRLAKACAHGPRQAELVDELLSGKVLIVQDYWGMKIGKAHVGYESWKSLKKRLMKNGFVVEQQSFKDANGKPREVRMRFEVDFSSP